MFHPCAKAARTKVGFADLNERQVKMDSSRDIAIIGYSCRFAEADHIEAFWKNLVEGRACFNEIPSDRWSSEVFHSENPREFDRTYVRKAAFIEDVESFAAMHFGIAPRRVEVMDPQHRLILDAVRVAVQDSGYERRQLPLSRVGTFIGASSSDHRLIMAARTLAMMASDGSLGEVVDPEALSKSVDRVAPVNSFSIPGSLINMAAANVAYQWKFGGPAYTLDAACASALVAVHNAVTHIRAGMCDVAVAGGIQLTLTPDTLVGFSRIGAISRHDACRPFDAEGDGFVQGDGVGIVVLKRLDEAQKDGDRIHAVIRGTGINNDAGDSGPMAPCVPGQVAVIQTALRDAAIDAEDVDLVECHGTATPVGDPVEVEAIHQVFGNSRSRYISSVKGNIGHTLAAAGIAGLLKATLELENQTKAVQAGFRSAHPDLKLEERRLEVPRESKPASIQVAGVSSFGFGGTNCHVVLERAPSRERTVDDEPQLVVLSAGNANLLAEHAREIVQTIQDKEPLLQDIAYTLSAARRHEAYRCSLIAYSLDDLVSKLNQVSEAIEKSESGELGPEVFVGEAGSGPVAALFPGQGAQGINMFRDAFKRFSAFRDEVTRLAQASGCDGILDLLYPSQNEDEAEAALRETRNTQPALAILSLALFNFLSGLGLQVDFALGHSLGEFLALGASGALSDEECVQLVATRGQLMQELPGDHGAMAALRLSAEELSILGPLPPSVEVANINHPKQTVVAGPSTSVDALVELAENKGVKATKLNVSHAFHSNIVKPILGDLGSAISKIEFRAPKFDVWSCTSDCLITTENAAELLTSHATSPVNFLRGMQELESREILKVVELGTGALRSLVMQSTGGRVGHTSFENILMGLGRLVVQGQDLDLSALYPHSQVATLPPTRLETQRFSAIRERAIPLKISRSETATRVAPIASTQVNTVQEDKNLSELLALFQSQNQILAQHAEVIANQSRVLASMGMSLPDSPLTATVEKTPAPLSEPVEIQKVELQKAATPEPEVPTDWLPLVKDLVSEISAFPLKSLQPTQVLATELGFDSLMFAELASALQKNVPGLVVPQTGFSARTALQDVADSIPLWLGSAESPKSEIGELDLFEAAWVISPIQEHILEEAHGRRVEFVGDHTKRSEIAEAFEQRGAAEGSGDILVAFLNDTPAAFALAKERNANPPRVFLGIYPESHGIAGFLRALRHEWPNTRIVPVFWDGNDAQSLVSEAFSPIEEQEVRLQGPRETRRFTKATGSQNARFDGLNVVVSGGARGVGFVLAKAIAPRVKSLLLLGRRAESDLSSEEKAAIAQLSAQTKTEYLQLDVSAAIPSDLSQKLANYDGLIHAAGLLKDRKVDELSEQDLKAVWSAKVLGLRHLMQSMPNLKAVVATGSWAARFGNRAQTIYAAANDALADELNGFEGFAQIHEWPLWADTPMTESLSDAMLSGLEDMGVPVLSHEEGTRLFLAALEKTASIVTIGPELDKLQPEAKRFAVLGADSSDWVFDHRLKGKAVMPFAAALELALKTSGATGLEDFKLISGVEVSGPTVISAKADKDRLVLSVDGAPKYLGRTLNEHSDLPEISRPNGHEHQSWHNLNDFYKEFSFHGPKMRGIVSVEHADRTGFVGLVKTKKPSSFGGFGQSFSADPFMVDAGFQLVLYWLQNTLGFAAFPSSIEKLQVLGAPNGEQVRVVLKIKSSEDDLRGDMIWENFDGSPILVAHDLRATRLMESSKPKIKPEYWKVDEFPEVQALKQRLEMAALIGVQNPYFREHDGVAKNRAMIEGESMLNFSSYNYLGLSGHPVVNQAAKDAVEHYGTSVSASRLASGQIPLHRELEHAIASFVGVDAALVFSAGHHTNESVIGHLFGPGDLILHDSLAHNSIVTGADLSGAKRLQFPHNDHVGLGKMLEQLRPNFKKVGIIIEGVYSMDGDIPNLAEFIELKKEYGAILYVDEAHSLGCIGPRGGGIADYFGLDAREVDLWMGTLSKSFASCGGFIAGSGALIDYLKYTVPGFIFSAGISPANSAAALAAIQLIEQEPDRVLTLQDNSRVFLEACQKHGLDTGPSKDSAVVPVIVGNSFYCLQLSERLALRGINVQPIVYPAVDDEASRLRFFISSTHTHDELLETAKTVAQELGELSTKAMSA